MIDLRRYTHLAAALRIFRKRKIALLPPDTWDDINDRRLLQAYQKRKGVSSVLSLCFAEAHETYHHWKTFASGSDGVCIVFDKDRLEQDLPKDVLCKPVTYYSLDDLKEAEPSLDEFPFSKRRAYGDEREYRLLWVSKNEVVRAKEFDISPVAISRVIVNPWMPEALQEAVRETINAIDGFERLKIKHSKIIDGERWRRLADANIA